MGRSGEEVTGFGGAVRGSGERFRRGSWMAGSSLLYISLGEEAISITGEASGDGARLDRGSMRGSYPCWGGGGLFASVLEKGLTLSNGGGWTGDNGNSFRFWSSIGARKLSIIPPRPGISDGFRSKLDPAERDRLDCELD